jgi:hypothetical protein
VRLLLVSLLFFPPLTGHLLSLAVEATKIVVIDDDGKDKHYKREECAFPVPLTFFPFSLTSVFFRRADEEDKGKGAPISADPLAVVTH